jgi:hypothetical protein
VLERAHAADAVDISIAGNWDRVREDLGIEGQGLVPEDVASRRPNIFGFMQSPSVSRESAATATSPPKPEAQKPPGNRKERRRAQRKKERKNRRRGRKR